jgi:hypothetical protein
MKSLKPTVHPGHICVGPTKNGPATMRHSGWHRGGPSGAGRGPTTHGLGDTGTSLAWPQWCEGVGEVSGLAWPDRWRQRQLATVVLVGIVEWRDGQRSRTARWGVEKCRMTLHRLGTVLDKGGGETVGGCMWGRDWGRRDHGRW